ncbi:MAG: radical SAM protein [Candidatus Omnitrophica bacterium]|nr:radical SAM protein [Candidatus Omnitrophota bacterium]
MLTPTEVVIEITGHCNLDCGYCTQAKNSGGHIAVGTVQQLLTQMVRSHVPAVRFTGGEPLLHPKLSELLSCAKSHNLYTLLNTNATILDGKRLEIMARHVDNMLVSLQGFNDSSDRAMTFSPVPFSQKMRNVQKLRSAIPTLRIGTVITPALLKNWDKYVAIIKTIRPHSWEIFRPMSTPLRGRHSVSRANYHTIAGRLLALNQHGINAKIANALPFCMFPDTSIAASTMLGALSDDGHSRLVWDLRGFFKPSYFIDKDLGPKLSDAWKHPFLDKVRNGAGLPAECLTCLCWSRCRGGSRAQAYKHYRSYHARDPLFDRSSARRQARVFTAP